VTGRAHLQSIEGSDATALIFSSSARSDECHESVCGQVSCFRNRENKDVFAVALQGRIHGRS
ncbi:MAG TPA: hypothetical protein VNQ81_02745, partial [Povalibacter sp.]|nr:hypothetical protein [Povalibacter sp.]